jgi:hypothetical protein
MMPSQLTEEATLLQLYRLSFKFPSSRFNLASTVLVGLLSALYMCWAPGRDASATLLKETLKLGVALVPSILGFLIAGFTVFVTITKPGVFAAMARKEYEDTGESYLKYNLSAFMLAFVHYLAYLAFCLLFVYFGQPNGPITSLALWVALQIFPAHIDGYAVILMIAAVFVACWTWYLVMLLKSFIFNVYQVVVTSVRWDLEEEMKSHGNRS